MDIGTPSDTNEDWEDIKVDNEDSTNDNRHDEDKGCSAKGLTESIPDYGLSNIVKKDPAEGEDSYEMLDYEYGDRKLFQMIKVRREAKSACNICGHKTKGAFNTARFL